MIKKRSLTTPRYWLPTAFFLAAWLTGCIRISSNPPPETPAPTLTITAVPANNTAPTRTAVPPTPAPPESTPIQLAAAPTAEQSPLPALQLAPRWRLDAPDALVGVAMTSLDGGPLLDLAAVSHTGSLVTRGLNQEAYWSKQFAGPVMALAAADLDEDGIGDVIVGDGAAVALVAQGEVWWRAEVQAQVTALLPLSPADFGGGSLVAATADGRLHLFGAAGNLLWSPPLSAADGPITALATAVFDSGETILLAAAESGRLTAVNRQGTMVWQVELGSAIGQLFAVNLDDDGRTDIVAVTADEMIALNQSGGEMWRWPGGGQIGSVAAADLNGDGVSELLVGGGSAPGGVSLWADGRPQWQVTLGEAAVSAITGGDVDADGVVEWVIGDAAGGVTLLDGDGRIRAQFAADAPVSGLYLADMDRNPARLELAVMAGSSVYLLDVSGGETAVLPALPAPTATPRPAAAPLPPPSGNRPHYNLRITLDMTAYTAQIEQTVTLNNDSGDEWDELVFNISPAYWPGIFTLNAAIIAQNGVTETVTTTLESAMLHLPLSQPLPPGEWVTARFNFDLTLPRLDPVGWGPRGNAGWEPGLVQMGDFYPALVPYQSGSGWQTWQFTAVGDPVISSLADYDVDIVAAADLLIAAAGYTGTTDDGRHYRLSSARSFAFLASSEYVYFDDVADGIPVRVYVTRGYQSWGPVVLGTAVNALKLFTERYGPYPYPELIIAENGFLTSNEYSGFVSLGGYLFDTHDGGADSLLIAITAHEVSHQWWYGGVGNDQVHEPWLDESLAMISELFYYERYHPDLTDWWWGARVDRWRPTGWVDAAIYDYPDSPTFVHDVYSQAAYFLRDLRAEMGETAFRAFLRDYYRQNNGRFATKETFFTLAQTHTETDLTPLRSRYFRE